LAGLGTGLHETSKKYIILLLILHPRLKQSDQILKFHYLFHPLLYEADFRDLILNTILVTKPTYNYKVSSVLLSKIRFYDEFFQKLAKRNQDLKKFGLIIEEYTSVRSLRSLLCPFSQAPYLFYFTKCDHHPFCRLFSIFSFIPNKNCACNSNRNFGGYLWEKFQQNNPNQDCCHRNKKKSGLIHLSLIYSAKYCSCIHQLMDVVSAVFQFILIFAMIIAAFAWFIFLFTSEKFKMKNYGHHYHYWH